MGREGKPELYKRYPLANRLIYNGATEAHYLLGCFSRKTTFKHRKPLENILFF